MKPRSLRRRSARSTSHRRAPRVERFEERVLLSITVVSSTLDDGSVGSLRWAIGQANTPGSTIQFSIPGAGVHTINLATPLPAITVPITIDATTQTGYTNAPLIVLNGSGAGAKVDGLDLSAGNTTVKGLDIVNFTGAGISISAAGGDVIENNYIGVNSTGGVAAGNGGDGVAVLYNANKNTILDNVISGNTGNAIRLDGSNFPSNPGTSGNVVQGNFLGTNATGSAIVPNKGDGLYVNYAPNTTIGGTTAATRNIISGNANGMELFLGSDNSVIEGNYIGTDVTGTKALGNIRTAVITGDGIVLRGISNSIIGGTAPGAGNLISGNQYDGIDSFVIGSSNITIQGNIVGADVTGTKALGNANDGVYVSGPSIVQIGGIQPGAGNLISANGGDGINTFSAANQFTIQGNLIGTDITGTKRLGNSKDGVFLWSASDVLVGGTVPAAANIIASNGNNGIETFSSGTGLTIQGNFIGTDRSGSLNMGNGSDGVFLFSNNVVIGGQGAGAGNVIAFNGATNTTPQPGITVEGSPVTILSNDIFSNANLGINNNNVFDKNQQPPPVLTSVVSGATTSVAGALTAAANATYTIQFFANSSLDLAGHAEGQVYLGSMTVTTNNAGVASFNQALPYPSPAGAIVTATTTDAAGDTSEFSTPITATGNGSPLSDLMVTAAGPSTILHGANETYTFTVFNVGATTIFNPTFFDPLPSGTTFVSAGGTLGAATYNAAGGYVTASATSLAPNTSATVVVVLNTAGAPLPSLTNIGYVASDPSDFDRSDNFASVVTTLQPAADLSVSISSTPSGSVDALGTITYSITVTNSGPDTASAVILSETLPNSVSIVSITQSQGAPPVLVGSQVTESFGDMAAKTTATLTIVAQAPPDIATLNDSATVSSSTPDPNPGNNSALNTVTVTPVSDIQVSLTASSASVPVGTPLVYTLTATNAGPSVANGVIVSDTLPLSTLAAFVSATADSGPAPTYSGGQVTDNYGTLNPNQSVTITITVVPTVAAPPNVTDTASATSSEFDPVLSNNSASVTATVVPAADVAITSLTTNPGSVTATHKVIITVGFANNGPSPASGVSVVDTLPAGFAIASTSTTIGTFSVSGQTVTVNAGAMPSGATGTLTIIAVPSLLAVGVDTLSASISAVQQDPVLSNNTQSLAITVNPTIADVSITSMTAAPARVLVGANATFQVNILNSGPDPATGTILTDNVPYGMTILSAITTVGTTSVSGNTISIGLGTLAPGATATLTVVAQASANAVGTATSTASIAANEQDPNPSNNSATASTVVSVPEADLAITSVTAAPASVLLGQDVTFTIPVVNNGPDQATGVTIIDILPQGLSLISASMPNGSVQTQNNAAVATLSSLNSGAVATLTIVAQTTAVGSISNGATVSGSQVDPNPTNNAAGTAITVSPSADLQVKIVPTPVPALVGQDLTYTVTVTNAGPSPATNVALTDTLPANVTYLSATSSQGTAPFQVSGVVTAPLGLIAPGATATLTILVSPTGAAVGLISDTAAATADEQSPHPTDASATSVTTVSAVSNLSVAEVASSSQVTIGNTLTYTVTVTNPGPNDATNVLLIDTLPAGVVFDSATPSAGTASFALGTVTALLGTIPVGQSASVVIDVTPTAAATITNAVNIQADQFNVSGTASSSLDTQVVTPPGSLSFQLSTLTTNENAGTVPITIERSGGYQGVVTVHLATVPGGNAVPGVDYEPLSQTVVFGQGVLSQTVYLTVLPNPNDRTNEVVNLQLDTPTNGASLGATTTANVTILDTDPNIVGPTVTSLRLFGPASAVTLLDFGFSKPLNAATATNPNNYHILAPGNVPIPVAFAIYDPSNLTVLVSPAVPLRANVTYLVAASGTQPGAIMDLAGNPLNSVYNVIPASDFVSPVARGTKIAYTDAKGAKVSLSIRGGGILDLSDFAQGQAPTLQVLNPVPRRSVIVGSVKPGGRATQLYQILGLGRFGAVQTKMLVPPFFPEIFPFTSKQSTDAPAVDGLLPSAPPRPRIGAHPIRKPAKHR